MGYIGQETKSKTLIYLCIAGRSSTHLKAQEQLFLGFHELAEASHQETCNSVQKCWLFYTLAQHRLCMAREAFSPPLSLLLILSFQQTKRALSLELLLVSWVGEMEMAIQTRGRKQKGLKIHSEFVHEDRYTPIVINSGIDPRDFMEKDLQILLSG